MPDLDSVSLNTDASALRRRGLIILGVVSAVVAVVFVAAFAPKGNPSNGVLPVDPKGYVAPALVLPSLNSPGDLDLSSYRGKPVVLNFWASWCLTCKDEAAILAEASRKWSDQGVIFLGVDTSDKRDAALAFAAKYNFDYDSFFDPQGTVGPKWGVTGYPETFFIDANGRIVEKFISAIDAATLDANIARLIE